MIYLIAAMLVLTVVSYVSFLVFCIVNFRRNGPTEFEGTEHLTRHAEAQDRGDFYHHT